MAVCPARCSETTDRGPESRRNGDLPTLLTAGHDHAPGERPWSIDVQGQLETHAETPATPAEVDLTDPALYLNRELSWLEFNHRVLEEAQDRRNPLFERVKFFCIVSSNLDEFF